MNRFAEGWTTLADADDPLYGLIAIDEAVLTNDIYKVEDDARRLRLMHRPTTRSKLTTFDDGAA